MSIAKTKLPIKQFWVKGFTFVEVIIALVIVSISMLTLLKLHLKSIKTIDSADITYKAAQLANEKIAEVIAGGHPKPGNKTGTVQIDGRGLKWQRKIIDAYTNEFKRADINGLYEILVDVSWKQTNGHKHIKMSTYVADRNTNEH